MGTAASSLELEKSSQQLLLEEIASDSTFWSQFWLTPTTQDEVFSIFKPNYIREVKKKFPNNLVNLLKSVVHNLGSTIQSNDQQSDLSVTLLNCIRIITRVVPYIFEDGNNDEWDNLFWSPTTQDSGIPLAVTIINYLTALLFLPRFTISELAHPILGSGFLLPLNCVWASGIGVSEVLASNYRNMLINRTEVLRAILACFSQAIYTPPDQFQNTSTVCNKFLDYLCCTSSFYSLALFYSLVNASCNYDPIGWGVPYNYLMFADYQEELADLSLQMLTILLNHNPISYSSKQNQQSKVNVFVVYLSDLNKKEDFAFLLNAFIKILNNPVQANQTYLPNSTKSVESYQEALVFLWNSIQYNKAFLDYICTQENVLKLVEPLIYFVNDGRKDSSKLGLIHLCTFVLLVLSGERQFCIHLNRVFYPIKSAEFNPFSGSYIDCLIMVFHRLFTDAHEKLESLYECLLTVLANMSPYIKSLAMGSSMKLLKLFELVSKPGFIFSSDKNYRFSFFLLESFNNIIQYQYEGNKNLVYSILRNEEAFSKLSNLQMADYHPKLKPTDPAKEANEQISPSLRATSKQFVPTEEWLSSWKQHLPTYTATIIQLTNVVSPQIRTLLTGSASDETNILDFLAKSTLVGILPLPNPILIRKYQSNEATDVWFSTFIWSLIYKKNPLLFGGTKIKLFLVSSIQH